MPTRHLSNPKCPPRPRPHLRRPPRPAVLLAWPSPWGSARPTILWVSPPLSPWASEWPLPAALLRVLVPTDRIPHARYIWQYRHAEPPKGGSLTSWPLPCRSRRAAHPLAAGRLRQRRGNPHGRHVSRCLGT